MKENEQWPGEKNTIRWNADKSMKGGERATLVEHARPPEEAVARFSANQGAGNDWSSRYRSCLAFS